MRSRRCLRVILDGKNRQFCMAKALNCLVIEIYMGQLCNALQRIHIHSKTMVLRSNLNLLCGQIHYWLIPAVVSEFKLVCFSAKGQSKYLVAETDAEYGLFADELSCVLNGVCNSIRVPGAVTYAIENTRKF